MKTQEQTLKLLQEDLNQAIKEQDLESIELYKKEIGEIEVSIIMEIKYRKMTTREIELAVKFEKFVKDYHKRTGKINRFKTELRTTVEDRARGWKTQIGQNVRGVCI